MGMHVHRVSVLFGDCDPAGIIYFPRVFDYFHQAMESWFAQALGLPYAEVVRGRKLGFPAVHTEADFRRPCFLGDEVDITLRVAALGNKSIRLEYVVTDDDGEVRATGATVCVVTRLDPQAEDHLAAISVPDDLRDRIEAFRRG